MTKKAAGMAAFFFVCGCLHDGVVGMFLAFNW
jgi:hypothetical protein